MTTQIYIVIGVFLLFIALILSGKVKIHVAAMVAQQCSGFIPIGGNSGGYLAQNTMIWGFSAIIRRPKLPYPIKNC